MLFILSFFNKVRKKLKTLIKNLNSRERELLISFYKTIRLFVWLFFFYYSKKKKISLIRKVWNLFYKLKQINVCLNTKVILNLIFSTIKIKISFGIKYLKFFQYLILKLRTWRVSCFLSNYFWLKVSNDII
jgi:hypothetical protein